jgi:hypothetical protein
VRENLDEEFTNFGQHYRFHFIPINEFWLDQQHAPGEEQFFIDHLLVEYRLMRYGMDYGQTRQLWAVFLRNHREVIAAMDFFAVPTLTFRVL